MEKDGGRVEKQTKAKLCNGRVGGDVHAASGGVACLMVYSDLLWGGSCCGGFLFTGSCMGKHVAVKIHVAINTWCYASIFLIVFYRFFCLY